MSLRDVRESVLSLITPTAGFSFGEKVYLPDEEDFSRAAMLKHFLLKKAEEAVHKADLKLSGKSVSPQFDCNTLSLAEIQSILAGDADRREYRSLFERVLLLEQELNAESH